MSRSPSQEAAGPASSLWLLHTCPGQQWEGEGEPASPLGGLLVGWTWESLWHHSKPIVHVLWTCMFSLLPFSLPPSQHPLPLPLPLPLSPSLPLSLSSPDSLLVQLSHHTLRGTYHHSDPEDAFEAAIHSVTRPSDLQIVWLEYLSYLRDNATKNRSSHNAFKVILVL